MAPAKQAKMTRVHFQFIADTIKEIENNKTRREVALLFSRRLRLTNARFKADLFEVACNIPDSEEES